VLVLKDGAEVLASKFTEVFKKIYQTKQLPNQWKICEHSNSSRKGTRKTLTLTDPFLTFNRQARFLKD
jgi:hypothetical protein